MHKGVPGLMNIRAFRELCREKIRRAEVDKVPGAEERHSGGFHLYMKTHL